MAHNTRPVILVSTGRTATKFLAELFNILFPEKVAAYHDTRYSTFINLLTNAYLANLLPKSILTGLWYVLKGNEIERCSKPYFIDSNNHLYGFVVIAPELYPDLKVVHLVRDPRTYVRSHFNWSQQRIQSWIANYILPFWQPNPFLMREMSWSEWQSLSKFEHFCWIWIFKNRYIQSLENTATSYLRIRFEDLIIGPDPEKYLNQLLEFIDLPTTYNVREYFDRPVNITTQRSLPGWREWEPKKCARLQHLCGALMTEYGYGYEQEWQQKVSLGQGAGFQ